MPRWRTCHVLFVLLFIHTETVRGSWFFPNEDVEPESAPAAPETVIGTIPVPSIRRALGIDIGGSGIKGALVDVSTGTTLGDWHRIPTPKPATPSAVAEVVGQIASHFAWTAGSGVAGIAFPAVVRRGMIKTAQNVDKSWIGINATELFGVAVGTPVHIINDADAAGVAEITVGVGAAHKAKSILLLTLGTGVGSALFANGQLYPNTEFGTLVFNGTMIEHHCSGRSRKRGEPGELTWTEFAGRLSWCLQYLNAHLSPDLIILGGGVSKHSHSFMPLIDGDLPPLVPAKLVNRAGIIGAALAAVQHFRPTQDTASAPQQLQNNTDEATKSAAAPHEPQPEPEHDSGVWHFDAASAPQLRRLFFNGDPWLILCTNTTKVDSVGEDGLSDKQLLHTRGLAIFRRVAEMATTLKHDMHFEVGTLDCGRILPSGKTVFERFKITQQKGLSAFILAGDAPVSVPTTYFVGFSKERAKTVPGQKKLAKALLQYTGSQLVLPKPFTVTTDLQLRAQCLRKKQCALVVHPKDWDKDKKAQKVVSRVRSRNRHVTWVIMNAKKYSLSLEAKLKPADIDPDQPRIFLFRIPPPLSKADALAKKKQPAILAKRFRGKFKTAEVSAFLSEYSGTNSSAMAKLKTLPTMTNRDKVKRKKELEEDKKAQKKKNERKWERARKRKAKDKANKKKKSEESLKKERREAEVKKREQMEKEAEKILPQAVQDDATGDAEREASPRQTAAAETEADIDDTEDAPADFSGLEDPDEEVVDLDAHEHDEL